MSWLSELFGGGAGKNYQNPADKAMPYLNQIPGSTAPYLQPYMNYGQAALPELQGQYSELLHHPGEKVNEIGSSFHQSPGFQFALQQALQGADHAAAAGGMAGSPQHQQQNMELATNLGNQDYYNWLGHAQGLYGQGLQGEQGFARMGQQASTNLADMIAQTLAQQGQLSYAGQQNINQLNNSRSNAKWGALGQGLGALSAFIPFKSIGNGISHLMGGQ